jgi:3-oxoacyl-[acyl-carrier protein] reductase
VSAFSLAGKTAIVTGGASGIGAAIVARFREVGAKVLVADRKLTPETRDGCEADVSREADIARMFEAALARFGSVEILVNNAGIQPLGIGFAELTEELLARTFAVNVQGTALAIKHAAKSLAEGGRVINIASFTGIIGAPRAAAYASSKAAVIHLTKLAALELAPRKITVNAISPGTIRTPAVTDIPDNPEIAFIERRTPLGRLGEPEEVAALAQFLASDEAAYLTGQNIALDGGLTAGWTVHEVIPPPNVQGGRWLDDL